MQMSVPAIVNSATTNDPKGGTDDSIICVCAAHIGTRMHQSLGQVSRDLGTSRLGWPHLIEDVAALIELLDCSKNANNNPRVIGSGIGIAPRLRTKLWSNRNSHEPTVLIGSAKFHARRFVALSLR